MLRRLINIIIISFVSNYTSYKYIFNIIQVLRYNALCYIVLANKIEFDLYIYFYNTTHNFHVNVYTWNFVYIKNKRFNDIRMFLIDSLCQHHLKISPYRPTGDVQHNEYYLTFIGKKTIDPSHK